jgi:hypothetical protein
MKQKEASPNKEENKNHNSISLDDRHYSTNSNHKMELWDMKVRQKSLKLC